MKTRRAAEPLAATRAATGAREADSVSSSPAGYASFSGKIASGTGLGVEGRAKRVEQSTRQLKGLFVANNNK